MANHELTRRDLVKAALSAVPLAAFDWDAIPAKADTPNKDAFDAVIIGSGLGGLSCAFAFARKGYQPLVIEQHDKPGGYATAFERPGGFVFDVSLHSTSVGERNGVRNLLDGLPEITDVEFLPHPYLYRAIFPEHDIRVEQRDVPGYIARLIRLFPEEKQGIEALFGDMGSMWQEVMTLSAEQGNVDMSRFVEEFPMLVRYSGQTWGQMADTHLRDPKLKAIASALWAYFGLPPSKLASVYYAMPVMAYLKQGGYYPRGRSQTISDAMVKFIESRGGKLLLETKVEQILTKGGVAYGVRCAGGREYTGRAVISNASAWHTFHRFLEDDGALAPYKERMAHFSTSLSSFQVFLGLKHDLVRQIGLKDSEVFVLTGYDHEAGYEMARRADVERGGYGVTLYDNIFPGYSPNGTNTVNLVTLQGFEHWEPFEADYAKGEKTAYQKEKERMADILIRRAEEALLPGLSKAIEVKEIGTPLTNLRYTGNYRGAIYGWDQTPDNSGGTRVGHTTPVKNLYLAGAWSRPGHGYAAVVQSGLECFGEVVRAWS